jgi:hypothetical protein
MLCYSQACCAPAAAAAAAEGLLHNLFDLLLVL